MSRSIFLVCVLHAAWVQAYWSLSFRLIYLLKLKIIFKFLSILACTSEQASRKLQNILANINLNGHEQTKVSVFGSPPHSETFK
jgi:hypothetical protein